MLREGSLHATKAWSNAFAFGRYVLVVCVLGLGIFLPAAAIQAQTPQIAQNAQQVAEQAGIAGQSDLLSIIGNLIYIALSLTGTILLVILIYAGYLYMTAGGKMEQVEVAKKWIRNAIIGLVIIASAFALTAFILNALSGAMGLGGGGVTLSQRLGGGGFPGSASCLGNGIEYHVPERDATEVPRNTGIAITFRQAIDPASFIKDWTEETSTTNTGLNNDAVKIFPTGHEDQTLASIGAHVRYTQDFKTYVIRPEQPLGSPTRNTPYTVSLLPGSSGIRLRTGEPACGELEGYIWQFEVSTILDLTPPQVISAQPEVQGSYAPNIIIQIVFSEPIDPTSASGKFNDPPEGGIRNFLNLEVRATANAGGARSQPSGEFKVSNHFTTVEFTPKLTCGTNTCGGTMYCLPFDSSIAALVKAATLEAAGSPTAHLTDSGYDGVVDLAANSLDGNANGTAQGQPVDNYGWSFGTGIQVNRNGPRLTGIVPPQMASEIPVDQKPRADFGEVLRASTVISENALIRTNEPAELRNSTFWFTPQMFVVTSTDLPDFGRIEISHRLYLPAPTSTDWMPLDYDPFLFSGLQNLYQNCFNPAVSTIPPRGCLGAPFCCNNESRDHACNYPPTYIPPPSP